MRCSVSDNDMDVSIIMVKIFFDMELSYNPDQSHEIYGQEIS